jgi:hypothetical protein
VDDEIMNYELERIRKKAAVAGRGVGYNALSIEDLHPLTL